MTGPASRSGPALPLSFALTFGAGLLAALQSRVNGELGSRTGSALWAAVVSFGSGLILVAVLVAALPATRRRLRPALTARLPWWTYLGGLGGASLVAVAAISVPQIGVATFTVGVVAGQAIGGLLVDRSPLVPGEPRPLSPLRILGAGLAVLAVVVIRLGHDTGAVSPGTVLVLLLASAGVGLATSVQQALNGRVQQATGHPLIATLGNFIVGTIALLVVFAGSLLAGAGPQRPWPGGAELYIGGTLGVAFIAIAAWTVRGLGVLRLGLLTVAGQLAGGVLIDLVSPGRTGGVDAATVTGVVLTLLGVALAGYARTPAPLPPGPAQPVADGPPGVAAPVAGDRSGPAAPLAGDPLGPAEPVPGEPAGRAEPIPGEPPRPAPDHGEPAPSARRGSTPGTMDR